MKFSILYRWFSMSRTIKKSPYFIYIFWFNWFLKTGTGNEKNEFNNLLYDIILKYTKKQLYEILTLYLNDDRDVIGDIYDFSLPSKNINKCFIKGQSGSNSYTRLM